MAGPLTGIRVVELGQMGPAPHAAMVLGDLGADVVRVDRPVDPSRLDAPREDDILLRSRRSVVADLKTPAGVDLVRRLARRADIFIEGYRPGVAERLGIGPDDLIATNPGLVYARMTGWGQDGPMKQAVGHDINYISVTGALASIAREGQPPTVPLNIIGDYGGGSMLLLTGVLAALVERATSGQGQVVDVAMVDGAALLTQLYWSLQAQGSWVPEPSSNLLDGGAPFYDVYPCADGRHVAVGALEPQFYAELLEGLGLDPDGLPDQNDRSGWPVLRDHFAKAFAARSRDEWVGVFATRAACVTPVLTFDEARRHDHLVARRTLTEIDGVTQAAPAPRFSRTPATDTAWPPRIPGEDTDAVVTSWDL